MSLARASIGRGAPYHISVVLGRGALQWRLLAIPLALDCLCAVYESDACAIVGAVCAVGVIDVWGGRDRKSPGRLLLLQFYLL